MTDTVIEMFDTESDVDDGAARGEAKRLMQHCYQGLQNLLDRYQDSAVDLELFFQTQCQALCSSWVD